MKFQNTSSLLHRGVLLRLIRAYTSSTEPPPSSSSSSSSSNNNRNESNQQEKKITLSVHKPFPSKSIVTRQIWGSRMKNIVFEPSAASSESHGDPFTKQSGLKDTLANLLVVGGNPKLSPKRMSDSYCQVEMPFGTNPNIREEYVNVFGGLRYGKLLEDLDALAGSIAYAHCDHNGNGNGVSETVGKSTTEMIPWVIVTASMDRMDWMSHLKSTDNVRMAG